MIPINFQGNFQHSGWLHSLYRDHEDMKALAFVHGVYYIQHRVGFIIRQTLEVVRFQIFIKFFNFTLP